MPKIFWFALGGLALSIFFFVAGDWQSGIGTFVITGLACGLYEKLEQWGLVTTKYKIKTKPTESIAPHISRSLEPEQPVLPSPNPPEPPATPVKGLMRVDVTQTNTTVDVYITLSEQAAYLINNHNLGSIPIEQNFEKLSEHMANFKRMLNTAYDDTDANIASELSGSALESWNKTSSEWRREEKARQPHELKEEEDRYKQRNTVYIKDYLQYPYRKVVGNPLEASTYTKRLETEYLPRIKSAIEGASPSPTKSYEL